MATKNADLDGGTGSLRNGNRLRLDPHLDSHQQHVRMFVLSHLYGPLIGLALSGFLLLLGFPWDVRLGGFTAVVCLFWAYPAALALGVSYPLLCMASIQHLTFAILWASHSYGGLTSPFLLWLAIVPLLAFLYLAPSIRLWLILLTLLGLNTGLFAAFVLLVLEPAPGDPDAFRWLALLSLLAASAYVSMMAICLSQVLSSRNEMAQEVARQSATVTALEKRATELRRSRTAKIASLSRLVSHCKEPIEEILAHCGSHLSDTRDRQSDPAASDLNSIRTAASRLRELIATIEDFRIDLADRAT